MAHDFWEDEGSGMNINVSPDLVEPIIKAQLQTAIVRQLQSDENLIPKLVEAALLDKVDESGKKNKNYSSSNKYLFIDILCKKAIQEAAKVAMKEYLFIDILCKKAIQEAAKVAMKEYIEDNQDTLKRVIKKQLREQESTIAKIFVDGLVDGVQAQWSFNVKIPMPGSD
jgi:hypothetical protein